MGVLFVEWLTHATLINASPLYIKSQQTSIVLVSNHNSSDMLELVPRQCILPRNPTTSAPKLSQLPHYTIDQLSISPLQTALHPPTPTANTFIFCLSSITTFIVTVVDLAAFISQVLSHLQILFSFIHSTIVVKSFYWFLDSACCNHMIFDLPILSHNSLFTYSFTMLVSHL